MTGENKPLELDDSFIREIAGETNPNTINLKPGIDPALGENDVLALNVKFLESQAVKTLQQRLVLVKSLPMAFERLKKESPSIEKHPVEKIERMALVEKDTLIAELPEDTANSVKIFENVSKDGRFLYASIGGILDYWILKSVPHFRVRNHKNAKVIVAIAEDRLSATATFTAAKGTGLPLTINFAQKVIQKARVIKGIIRENINAAIEEANQNGQSKDRLIAKGLLPKQGKSEIFKLEVEIPKNTSINILSDGRADYKNINNITMVKKGSLLGRINRTKDEPRPGYNVLGSSIKPVAAPPLKLTIGENIEEKKDKKGNSLLYAAITGEFITKNDLIKVLNIHTVKGDVGPATGNIKFNGVVNISGFVCAGYFVISEGNINIKEGVEAALVSSKQSINILKGVMGHGKGVLQAGVSINIGFAQQSTLLSTGNIYVKRSCMNCTVKTNGKLIIGDLRKGVVMGGEIRARNGLETCNLGAGSKVPTYVSFGQDYLLLDKIEHEKKNIDETNKKLAVLNAFLENSKTEDFIDPVRLDKARQEKIKALKLIDKCKMKILMLREKFDAHHSSKVTVRGSVYSGVILESHNRTHKITQELRNVVFEFDQEIGRIIAKDII